MKASPLLRALLARLTGRGVTFHLRHDWQGWDKDGALVFGRPDGGTTAFTADATILALGGASWPRLGARGEWTTLLAEQGAQIAPFRSANCGFAVSWSPHMQESFAGTPLKSARFRFARHDIRGEAVVTQYGIEGGAIYALSAALRDAIAAQGSATLELDLRPDVPEAKLRAKLDRPRGKASRANHLRKSAGLSPLEIALLHEDTGLASDAASLAHRIKALPLTLTAPQALDRAISTAGGVTFASLDEHLMLRAKPGVYVAGEMLDWEAPTGGYLLQACFATGVAAAKGALHVGRKSAFS